MTKRKFNYDLYKSISILNQESLLKTMSSTLKSLYSEERVITTSQYVYAIGDIPVMLVAHLDTVHKTRVREIFFDKDEQVIWSPQGLGADDRAGVYSILQILLDNHRPHILFVTDEEIGSIGAESAATTLTPEVNFLIELDRQGENDSVYYSIISKPFENYINQYGFTTDIGSFSDICVLCSAWETVGVNLSIGYQNEHSKAELLNINHMHSTIDKVEKILENVNPDMKFEYREDIYNFYDSWLKYYNKEGMDLTGTSYKDKEICYECFRSFPKELIIKHGQGNYCGECFAKVFSTCTKCGEVFRNDDKTHLLCERCRKEV